MKWLTATASKGSSGSYSSNHASDVKITRLSPKEGTMDLGRQSGNSRLAELATRRVCSPSLGPPTSLLYPPPLADTQPHALEEA